MFKKIGAKIAPEKNRLHDEEKAPKGGISPLLSFIHVDA